jgi:MoaA/NifB/PqqE/SkfB family radical SAM enzyme
VSAIADLLPGFGAICGMNSVVFDVQPDPRCSLNCRSCYVEIAFPGASSQPLTFQLLSGWRCMV